MSDHRTAPADDPRRRWWLAGIALVVVLVLVGAVFGIVATVRGSGDGGGRSPAAGPPGSPGASASQPNDPSTTTSPTPAAPPARQLTERNLLAADDVPLEDYDNQSVVVVKAGVGRPEPESSVCLPGNGLTDLGAQQVLSRNFRYQLLDGSKPDADDPFRNQPIIYTQALQFADAAAAKAARNRYQGWLKDCPAALQAKGYQLLPDLGFDPTPLEVEQGSATATELAYQRPGGADGENGIWESVGLTVVGDRMMITVYVHWGMDWEVTIDAAEGDLLHPQLGLCDAASARLALK